MWTNEVGLIVTDMDGTFLGAHSEILPENGEALRRAARAGIHIGFASGRLPCMLSRFAQAMELPQCHIIGLNGAHVLDAPYGQTLALHAMSEEARAECLRLLHREGCMYNLYTEEGVYTNRAFTPEEKRDFRRRFAGCQNVVIAPDAAQAAQDHPCVKFFVHSASDEAAYARAKAAFAELSGVEVTSSVRGTFEIMPAGVDKASAVHELADRLGVSMGNVMAFGDYDNDVAMLSACGYSVAMANGTPAARAAAAYETLSNTESGVAHAIALLMEGRLEALGK